MKCFYHNSNDAVGICKNCNKGICPNCSTDLLNGIACKDKCESEVEAVNQIIDRGKTGYKKTGSAYSQNSIIYLMLGVAFVVFGGMEISTRPLFGSFLLIPGMIFLVGAFFNYTTSKKFLEK